MLNADAEVLVVSHAHMGQGGQPTWCSDGRSVWHTEEEIGQSPRRHHVLSRIRRLADIPREEVKIEADRSALGFVENAVTTADNGPLAETPPRQTEAGCKLPLIRNRNGFGQPHVIACLDQILERRITPARERLIGQIN